MQGGSDQQRGCCEGKADSIEKQRLMRTPAGRLQRKTQRTTSSRREGPLAGRTGGIEQRLQLPNPRDLEVSQQGDIRTERGGGGGNPYQRPDRQSCLALVGNQTSRLDNGSREALLVETRNALSVKRLGADRGQHRKANKRNETSAPKPPKEKRFQPEESKEGKSGSTRIRKQVVERGGGGRRNAGLPSSLRRNP